MIIAVDGTSGSGKSGLCKKVAKELGFTYIRSSSFYRALTYKVLLNRTDVYNPEELSNLLKNTTMHYDYVNEHVVLIMDGIDVSEHLHSIEVSHVVALVASLPEVRKYVRKCQHQAAKDHANIIMEGRDIGSVIFPNADLKIYVDCDIDERARRRLKQYAQNGTNLTFEEIKQSIISRDKEDTSRHDSPLVRVPDAFYLDTTNINEQQCVDIVIEQIKLKQAKK